MLPNTVVNREYVSQALQGNCSSSAKLPTGSPPSLPLKPQQCILRARDRFFQNEGVLGVSFWISNLYLQQPDRVLNTSLVAVAWFGAGNKVWITNVTFEGNANFSTAVITTEGSSMYVGGTQQRPQPVFSVVHRGKPHGLPMFFCWLLFPILSTGFVAMHIRNA
jgi:hypothetical protein